MALALRAVLAAAVLAASASAFAPASAAVAPARAACYRVEDAARNLDGVVRLTLRPTETETSSIRDAAPPRSEIFSAKLAPTARPSSADIASGLGPMDGALVLLPGEGAAMTLIGGERSVGSASPTFLDCFADSGSTPSAWSCVGGAGGAEPVRLVLEPAEGEIGCDHVALAYR